MRRTLCLNVVGLTPRLLGPHTPNLSALAARGGMRPLRTIEPAVTCAVQSTFTTGLLPRDHGCVANGWDFSDIAEMALGREANAPVTSGRDWDARQRREP